MEKTKSTTVNVHDLPKKQRHLLQAAYGLVLDNDCNIDTLSAAVEGNNSGAAKNRAYQTIARLKQRGLWPLRGDGQPESGAVRIEWSGNGDVAPAVAPGHTGNGDATTIPTGSLAGKARSRASNERVFAVAEGHVENSGAAATITTTIPAKFFTTSAATDEDQFIRDVLGGFAALSESAQCRVSAYLRSRLDEMVAGRTEY
jgi:hypothetical protein